VAREIVRVLELDLQQVTVRAPEIARTPERGLPREIVRVPARGLHRATVPALGIVRALKSRPVGKRKVAIDALTGSGLPQAT